MIIKTCRKCKENKEIEMFYVHNRMADGRLNICIDCTKKRIAEREEKLRLNPEWLEKEKARGRDKYHRLGCKKPTYEMKKKAMEKYKQKYPEKYIARSFASNLKPTIKGNHLHHWSYNVEHAKDVIELSEVEHNTLHRFIIYDQERMMYRKLDGELLDTKELHFQYFNSININ
jgi:hypothetical protein